MLWVVDSVSAVFVVSYLWESFVAILIWHTIWWANFNLFASPSQLHRYVSWKQGWAGRFNTQNTMCGTVLKINLKRGSAWNVIVQGSCLCVRDNRACSVNWNNMKCRRHKLALVQLVSRTTRINITENVWLGRCRNGKSTRRLKSLGVLCLWTGSVAHVSIDGIAVIFRIKRVVPMLRRLVAGAWRRELGFDSRPVRLGLLVHWDSFVFQYFSFPLSVWFHHSSILIHSSTTHAV
jgi:hypothetical protein